MPLRINNIMYAHPLSHNLYGLHLNLDNIKRAKRIIIFEAEKSVLLYDSFFGEDSNISVATCGNSLSLFQQDIIKEICGVDEEIIAYDKEFEAIGDNNFKKNIATLNSLGSKLKNYCNVSLIFSGCKISKSNNSSVGVQASCSSSKAVSCFIRKPD